MILFYFIEHNIFVEDEILGAIIIIDVAHVEHSWSNLAQMHLVILDI
jgi:hypothetical protein